MDLVLRFEGVNPARNLSGLLGKISSLMRDEGLSWDGGATVSTEFPSEPTPVDERWHYYHISFVHDVPGGQRFDSAEFSCWGPITSSVLHTEFEEHVERRYDVRDFTILSIYLLGVED